jgi:hypothetical protein
MEHVNIPVTVVPVGMDAWDSTACVLLDNAAVAVAVAVAAWDTSWEHRIGWDCTVDANTWHRAVLEMSQCW